MRVARQTERQPALKNTAKPVVSHVRKRAPSPKRQEEGSIWKSATCNFLRPKRIAYGRKIASARKRQPRADLMRQGGVSRWEPCDFRPGHPPYSPSSLRVPRQNPASPPRQVFKTLGVNHAPTSSRAWGMSFVWSGRTWLRSSVSKATVWPS